VLRIFDRRERTKELRFTKDIFEADLFAIVSKKVGKAKAAGLRAEPESMLLVAAAAYAVSSVKTCVKSGRKFHFRNGSKPPFLVTGKRSLAWCEPPRWNRATALPRTAVIQSSACG
jgi:hypothetical protein